MKTTAEAEDRTRVQLPVACEICGKDYGQGVEVVAYGQSHRFHSFACAIQALAPRCAYCRRRIVGRGPAASGSTFCCDDCANTPLSVRPVSMVGMANEMAKTKIR